VPRRAKEHPKSSLAGLKGRESVKMDEILVALLFPIVSLAVGSRLGADRFVRALKRAYIRAAIDEAFPASSKRNYSRLAVITGLTRKEVSQIVDQVEGRRLQFTRATRGQRALEVLRGWRMDPRFHDKKGHPANLVLRSGRRTFAALVKAYARDVTPMSVLTELVRLGAVSRSLSTNTVRLLSPRAHKQADAEQNMAELARLLGDFVSTINQRHAPDGRPAFFSFKDSVLTLPQQAARFDRVFSSRAAALLDSFDQWIASQPRKPRRGGVPGARVGIGVYLVHNDPEPSPPRDLSGAKRGKGRKVRRASGRPRHRSP
jgi:hypothetical protein